MLNTLLVTPKDEPEAERISKVLRRSARLRTIYAGETSPAKLRQLSRPDLIVVGSAKVSLIEIKTIIRAFPKAVIIVASKKVSTETSEQRYKAGVTAVVPLSSLGDAVTSLRTPDVPVRPSASAVVEELHDPRTGRLNAQAAANALGISVTALAKGVGLTPSALSKRPNAKAAQGALRAIEFSVAALRRVLGSDNRMRAWLNAPHPDLGEEPPIHLLTRGSVSEFANYVRSALAGQPT
jgi:hypothetical protein